MNRQSQSFARTNVIKINQPKHQSEIVVSDQGKSPTLTATDYKRPYKVAVKQIGNFVKTNSFGGNPQRGRVYDLNGISPTLTTMQGGDREPKVLVSAVLTPDRINKRQNGRRFKNIDEPEFTLTGQDRHGVLLDNGKFIAIRKLTPKECWRLQGFSDEQFEKAKEAGVSDCQLYKQAGNAVTVPVIEQIGKRLEVIGE
ncbi:hypothetical protein EFS61_09305 [Lactobacillus hominis]|nr:hypothetical protein [Lactobacillus hominis]